MAYRLFGREKRSANGDLHFPGHRRIALLALVLSTIFILPLEAVAAEVVARYGNPAGARRSPVADEADEPIVVTATRTARGVFRLPGEINVVERAAIEKTQARSLDDLFRHEPGVEMMGTIRRLGQTPNIRGLDRRRVLVLRDGARISQFTSGHKGSIFTEIDDVKRIEVVRGPVSSLYGSGALGGVISLQTLDPSDLLEPGRDLGARIGVNHSSAYREFMVSPRVFGRSRSGLEWLLGYTFRENNGGIRLGGAAPDLLHNEENIDGVTTRIVYPVTDNDLLRFTYDWLKNEGWTLTNLAVIGATPATHVDRRTENRTYTLNYERNGDRWWDENLKASVYRTRLELTERRLVGTRLDRIIYVTTGLNIGNTTTPGDRHRITYGVEYLSDQQKSSRDGGNLGSFPAGRQNQLGIYLQDEISLLDNRLSLVPGVRWDRWENLPANAALPDRSADRLNPKLGVSYELLDGWVVAATYGEGFRAPGFQELFVTGAHFPGSSFIPNPELKPERSRSWDAGLRYQRGDFSARGTYYRNEVKDFINVQNVIGTAWQHINVEDATIQGVEFALDWRFTPQWKLEAAYSRARGRNDRTGANLAAVPTGKAVGGLEWTRDDLGLAIGARARIYERRKHLPPGGAPQPGYTLYDAYLSWKPNFLESIALNFSVDNLTDKAYVSNQFNSMPGVGVDYRVGLTWHLGGSAR